MGSAVLATAEPAASSQLLTALVLLPAVGALLLVLAIRHFRREEVLIGSS
jgi:predicted MFS family arabinose efflux permease